MNQKQNLSPEEIDYPEMVRILKKKPEAIVDHLSAFPWKADLLHMAVGVAGEGGELLDACKKVAIYGQHPARVSHDLEQCKLFGNIIEELGDLEFYMEGLRQTLGISREETLFANKRKLAARYEKYAYSDEQAKARKDKQ